MPGFFTVEQEYSPKTRAQLRQAAEVLGIDEEYLRWMTKFFVARIRVDKRLGRIGATGTADDEDRQVERMVAFWSSIALHRDVYSGDLVTAHPNLSGLQRQDFDQWLELFQATLEETAPTVDAANYLLSRTEIIARELERMLFECPHEPKTHTDAK